MDAIVFIAMIVGAFFIVELNDRVATLERRLKELQWMLKNGERGGAGVVDDEGSKRQGQEGFGQNGNNLGKNENVLNEEKRFQKPVVVEHRRENRILRKSREVNLEEFFGRRFFSVLGAITVVAAIGFFSIWAYERGIVGPWGRVGIGSLVSVLFIIGGEVLRRREFVFYEYISAVGFAGLMAVTYVASSVHELILPMQAFGIYAVVVAVGLVLAVVRDARALGNIMTVGGLVTPILIGSQPNWLGLMIYLLVLVGAGVVIFSFRKWTEILVMVLLGSIFFELGIAIDGLFGEGAVLFAGMVLLLHYLIFGALILRRVVSGASWLNVKDRESMGALVMGIGSLVIANFIGYNLFEGEGLRNYDLVLFAQGVVMSGVWLVLWSKRWGILTDVCLGVALTVFTLGLGVRLGPISELILVVSWVIESLILLWIGWKYQSRLLLFFSRGPLVLAFMALFGVGDVFWERTIADWAVILGMGASAVFRSKSQKDNIWPMATYMIASLIVLIWDFVALSEFIQYDLGFRSPSLYDLVPLAVANAWVVGSIWVAEKRGITKIPGAGYFPLGFLILVNLIFVEGLSGYVDEYWVVPALALVVTLVSNYLFFEFDKRQITTRITLGCSTFSVLGYGVILLDEPALTMVWMAWALVALLIGIFRDWKDFRYVGIGILLLVLAKVYLVDVWGWVIWIRFVVFGVLGAVLLGVSYYYSLKEKKG